MPRNPSKHNNAIDLSAALSRGGLSPIQSGLNIKAAEGAFFSTADAGTIRTPMMYMDPLSDQILMLYPQDNPREANRRFRHYYKFQPYIRNIIDFHTETPLSDFYLRCEGSEEAETYFNNFKDDKELLSMIVDMHRDYWLLGEAFMYANWDEYNQEFSSFVQYPPEEVEVYGVYTDPKRIYTLRPNQEIRKLFKSSDPAARLVAEHIKTNNPKQAEYIMKNKPYPVDGDRMIVLQRTMARYVNRGVSPLLAVLKDLLYEDNLIYFRNAFIQRHCFSVDTELLTADGFKNVAGIKKGEMLATFNPKTEQIEYGAATEMNSFDYNGEMIEYDTEYCQLKVTPEHNMWLKPFPCGNGKKRPWMMRQAKDTPVGCNFRSVANWEGAEPTVTIDVGGNKMLVKDFLKLAGFYISEGCCTEERTTIITQSSKSVAFNDSMKNLIASSPMPIKTYKYAASTRLNDEYVGMFYKIFSKSVAEYMSRQFGRTSLEKKIPSWIKGLSKEYLRILLDALILGDGSDKISDGVRKLMYYTSSKQLADDVQEIVLKLGYSSIIRAPEQRSELQKHPRYIVSIHLLDGRKMKRGAFPQLNKRSQIKHTHYNDKVYCPTVPPHHLVFARRNGRVVITGQSYPLKIFKLGSESKGFIPSKKMFDEFRSQLVAATNDPDFNLITHPFVTVDSFTGHDKILNLIPYFELVQKRIFAGLFVSEAIITGEKTPYSAGITWMRGLMNRYLTIRNQIQGEISKKVFKPLARLRKFYAPTQAELTHRVKTRRDDSRLIVPTFYWQKANLMSNQAIMQMIIGLSDKNKVPFRYVTEMFGWDLDDMIHQLKREEGSRVDPLWRDLRNDVVKKDKILTNKILLGDDIDAAIKAKYKQGGGGPEAEPEVKPGKRPGKKVVPESGSSARPPMEPELATRPTGEEGGEKAIPTAPEVAGDRKPRPNEAPEGGGE